MKRRYYSERDSLYIYLFSKPSLDSQEISEGIVLDYDVDGNLTGIDIDNARNKIDLYEVVLSKIPAELQSITS